MKLRYTLDKTACRRWTQQSTALPVRQSTCIAECTVQYVAAVGQFALQNCWFSKSKRLSVSFLQLISSSDGKTERERDGWQLAPRDAVNHRMSQTDRHWLYLINVQIDQKLRLGIFSITMWMYRQTSLSRMCGVLCSDVLSRRKHCAGWFHYFG